jgi:drug/metabolite transporter (DMT)-like permease
LQALFLLGLAGVALATLAGEQLGWQQWIVSAFTLGVMIVAAVADFTPHLHDPHA